MSGSYRFFRGAAGGPYPVGKERALITRLTHVTRHVDDLDEALAFYRDLLGLRVDTDQELAPGQRWLALVPEQDDVQLVLLDPRGWFDRERAERALAGLSEQPQLILATDYIDELFLRLQAAEAPLDTPGVRDQPWGRDLVVRDPTGSSVNVVQPSA
jgi:catechol 2,3-dioxygenase-like lactoylglutathione lyase family enzyme